jgi:vitamin B12 transporter
MLNCPEVLPLFAFFLAQTPTRLPETVVVETRQAAPLAEASPSVSRLDAGTASEQGISTLTGLLGSAPGVYATEQSGEGSVGSLLIRGTNSSQTAVLLDGRRLPQGFSNSYEIGRYRIFGLSSVEIMRGPSSTLYGANALGGVVDLRLPDPLTDKSGGTLNLEAGAYGRTSLGFSYLTNNADGKSAATQGTAFALTTSHDDGWRVNGAREASTGLLKSEWRLSANLVFDLIGSVDRGNAGLPGQATNSIPASGDPNDWQKDRGWMLSPGLRYDTDTLSAVAFWSHGGSTVTSYVDGTDPFYGPYLYYQKFNLDRDELTAFADWKVRRNLTLGLGLSYENSRYDQQALAAGSTHWEDTMESFGVWTRADWRATEADRFRAAVRRDSFSDFAGKTTGEFSYARTLSKELTLHAKAATADRAPSANDLAYGTSGGLPLRPEANTGYEVGLRHEDAVPNALNWTLVAFQNNLTDLIDYNPVDYKTFNIAKARTQGIELGAEARPAKGLRVFGAATYLDSKALTDYAGVVTAGQPLLRRPHFVLSLGTEITPNENWTFGAALNVQHGRVDYDWNSYARINLPDATFCRLWVRYAWNDQTELSLRIENLFGETAPPTALGYGAQPRSAYVGLTRKF